MATQYHDEEAVLEGAQQARAGQGQFEGAEDDGQAWWSGRISAWREGDQD